MSNTPIQGKQPTQEEQALIEAAKDSLKSTTSKFNTVFVTLLTLNVGLLAVSMLFDATVLPKNERILAIICFLISLLVAIIGLIPFEGKVQMDTPDNIKSHITKATNYKKAFVIASVVILLIGIVIIIVNYLDQLFR